MKRNSADEPATRSVIAAGSRGLSQTRASGMRSPAFSTARVWRLLEELVEDPSQAAGWLLGDSVSRRKRASLAVSASSSETAASARALVSDALQMLNRV
jgi:hypothetical protein